MPAIFSALRAAGAGRDPQLTNFYGYWGRRVRSVWM